MTFLYGFALSGRPFGLAITIFTPFQLVLQCVKIVPHYQNYIIGATNNQQKDKKKHKKNDFHRLRNRQSRPSRHYIEVIALRAIGGVLVELGGCYLPPRQPGSSPLVAFVAIFTPILSQNKAKDKQ